jgi:uncharacterized protein YndB with AHSA1/START domain
MTTHISRNTTIAQPAELVFDYVSNFDNFTRWSTDVVRAELLTAGPVRQGTKARIVRQALGQHYEMHFHLVDYEPHRVIGFQGHMLGIPFGSRMEFEPQDARTHVVQSGTVKVPFLLAFAEPTVRQVLATTFENDLRQLKHILESPQ